MIHILSPEIANRIAAGEVVERPASVVRELIDNAVDAGAGRIDIEVQEGGLGMIRVTDNGSGMSREDAQLCVKRHATSKINSADDLNTIHTRGFRGEALAAISSVSKFEIKTRSNNEELGSLLYVEGGYEHEARDTGTPVGTSVTVRDLFYNVPARRKFLKKPSTELSHLLTTITWNALAHESIHFTFSKNGRRSLDYPAVSNRPERIEQIFGKETLDAMIPVHYDSPEVTITGFISRPTLTRNNAQQIFFFVNDRYIRDRMLHTAMMNGYRSLIHSGRYPIVFLFYEINPEEIDINVHPTKQEIKFSRENAIFSATYRAIRQAWDIDNAPEPPQPTQEEFEPPVEEPQQKKYEPKPYITKQEAHTKEPSSHSISNHQDGSKEEPAKLETPTYEPPLPHEKPVEPDLPPKPQPAQTIQTKEEKPIPPTSQTKIRELKNNNQTESESSPSKQTIENLNRRPLRAEEKPQNALHDMISSAKKPDELFEVRSLEGVEPLQVRGQLLDSYILAESSEGLYIIDQHAAHERLKFEEFLTASQNKPLASQSLLFPLTIDLSPGEVAVLEDNLTIFQQFGFEIEPFGPQTFIIRSTPSSLDFDSAEEFIKDLLAEIENEGSTEEKRQRALHTMACRAAVKFGDSLTHDAMESIIRGLEAIPRRNVCPHGRPSILFVSDHSLQRLFKRLGF